MLQNSGNAEATSGRSLFLADAASIERRRGSIRSYKTRAAHAVRNVKEVCLTNNLAAA